MTTSSVEETVRQNFNRHAPRYGRNPFTGWIGRSELAAMQALIPPPDEPGITPALDFGCGTGRSTRLLLALGYRATGYDLSPQMLELAQTTLGQRATFTQNPQDIQQQWPLVVSLGVLDYYPDTVPLWQQWRRLLAPDGVLVVTAPNAASPLAWLYEQVSRFTCPAYLVSIEKLTTDAGRAGLIVTHCRATFPQHLKWGHTLVLRLQPE